MKENVKQRKNIRLKDYDYSKEGMYFITICVKDRLELLGKIVGADAHICPKIKLNDIGNIVQKYLININNSYKNITLMDYVIMPNHLHFIICIDRSMWASTPTLPQIIQTFKIIVSKTLGYSIWQRNYYEHIIRNEKEYYKIVKYIQNNSLKWEEDKYYIKY